MSTTLTGAAVMVGPPPNKSSGPATSTEPRPKNLAAKVEKIVSGCPRAGTGVHRWIYKVSCKLHDLDTPHDEIAELLRAATRGCGRAVLDDEIEDAVGNSAPDNRVESQSSWPSKNEQLIASITKRSPGMAGLELRSPERFDDLTPYSEFILDALFPGNPLLCLAASKRVFNTKPREAWRGREHAQEFIVPSPMASVRGLTQNGKPSQRCLENTGPRKFIVIEFDTGTFDDHAGLLLHLATWAPLAMVVHSGGKSAHGWFPCKGQPESTIKRFMDYAVGLGADPATWTRCQLVRLPGGTRNNGNKQRVIYFNRGVLEGP